MRERQQVTSPSTSTPQWLNGPLRFDDSNVHFLLLVRQEAAKAQALGVSPEKLSREIKTRSHEIQARQEGHFKLLKLLKFVHNHVHEMRCRYGSRKSGGGDRHAHSGNMIHQQAHDTME